MQYQQYNIIFKGSLRGLLLRANSVYLYFQVHVYIGGIFIFFGSLLLKPAVTENYSSVSGGPCRCHSHTGQQPPPVKHVGGSHPSKVIQFNPLFEKTTLQGLLAVGTLHIWPITTNLRKLEESNMIMIQRKFIGQ